jgi:polysaccharide biosynthesis transport protein
MDHVHDFSIQSKTAAALQPADFVRLVRTHIRWWAIPAVAFFVLAGAYSLISPRKWEASQAFIVRPEVASVSEERIGKFSDLSEMKTYQETILEIAKSKRVIQATLVEVGPPSNYRRPAEWPTALDIDDFRSRIDMSPPGGAEFGKTEVFYISIHDSKRDRASALVAAHCSQLEKRMQEIRGQRASGMIAELERTVAMANGDLASQTKNLSAFETKVGADLPELRNLNADVGGGQGEVSQERQAIEGERRANEARQNESERLLKLLVAAQNDPQQLLATPNSLLVSQPSVSQLKNAVVNAQLRTAELLGSRSENHPFVVAARESEALIRRQLNNEVAVAIRGLEVEIELCVDREKSLASKWSAARERMSHLAEARAEYSNLVASVQNHTRLVETARKNLADARARQASAYSGSVISRIDGVEAGVHPIGPGRKTITAAGGVAGLAFGFGLIFLFANPHPVSQSTPEVEPTVRISHNALLKPGDVFGPLDRVHVTDAMTTPVAIRPRSAKEAFGLFRGMSLQDAIKSVQRRGR